ncbi:acetolactate synthase [Catenulispora subtropica]|uniref:Acetolactate synthase n=1 Tax=Catenulispora subtropica TaxID=450798 RepID=A0ABN2RKE7_9ACTN
MTEVQPEAQPATPQPLHGGQISVEVARAHGVQTMFTLSGGHVFPLYDGAVKADPPMPILDVRHEQTAVFAAEATAKLTRRPGLAVLTAGPGITNGVSAVTTAHFNGSPVVVLGGRAADSNWGKGALQELDHPPLLAPVTKRSATVHTTAALAAELDDAFALADAPHRGPVFLDLSLEAAYDVDAGPLPAPAPRRDVTPDPEALTAIGELLARAAKPVLVLGSDVWMDGADSAALAFAEETGVPVITNGMGRGILPRGHRQLVTRARSAAFGGADLVIVAGTPLDFRLGYGLFGGRDGNPLAPVVHLADSPDQLSTHLGLAGSAAGDLSAAFAGIAEAWRGAAKPGGYADWLSALQDRAAAAIATDTELLTSASDPIHPARIYGELLPRLAEDAVVIGDGGDFVSWAGRFVEPARPGCWMDPGPYGCLGTGLGYAIAARLARPASQVVLMFGDGAAGFSLMDVDTLVRHRLPVVMVVGNNACWGLEKHPMQALYGYDVAADLNPDARYDRVVQALGGGGEFVTDPREIGPALDRAFASGVPYLVNIATDQAVAYPRSTTGL